jgi:inosine/xanthosine triphosphate pyrophosphatase family protein
MPTDPATAKEIIYGTTNPAKVAQIRDVLEPLGYTVKSLADFDVRIEVEEDGATAEENARKKAVTYAAALGRTTLSMDVALYFNDLPPDQQPGLHVRRINGHNRAGDDELVEHYARLVAVLGDPAKAYWRYGFALATPDGRCKTFTGDTPRVFAGRPSRARLAGYPLEALQIDPASGKYIADMTPPERADFWRRTVGVMLGKFITEAIIDL